MNPVLAAFIPIWTGFAFFLVWALRDVKNAGKRSPRT